MSDASSDAVFIERLTSCQVRLRAFALSIVPRSDDADDVLQSACVKLWEKRGDYDPDRNFFPWASGFVLIEVLRLRRKKATDKLMFGEALINSLAADYVAGVTEMDLRREQLRLCVAKLSPRDRDLLGERYDADLKAKQLAGKRGMPVTTVYSALARIRESLYRCIEANLAKQTHA
ncbi:RNA polymerase sigma factor [Pirellulimonas nuda]|uniref:RNA polymerase sigma factor n=1 Tax=Pirellulimonas nuda TaxID=2528009 RepID=A0A518DBK3_9BACT|nr:sigma-70 family RNA polymerase sigma factor [Pirellulimonas nuda]QDU88864.1 RNA polymerase sigma factor [Pirellulimonas nuda]